MSGLLLICNSLIYGFLLYYSISYLLSHLTFTQVENPSQFIFKLFLSGISLNACVPFCSFLIYIFSVISSSIKILGESLLSSEISFASLINNLNPSNYFLEGMFNLFSFDGLLKSLISISFISLTISYAVRYVMIKVFILLSPFAILSLSSNKTSWFFKSWLKTFTSMLFLQVIIALILLVYFLISKNGNYVLSQLLQFGVIFALVKANSFTKEFIGGLSSDVSLTGASIFHKLKGGNRQ